ncbi:MAG: hypothetical protein WDN50_20430 [Bradyrhizobium sp.]
MKVMLPTATPLERETEFCVDVPKMTAAAVLFGTVAGFQLPAVFQSPLPGEASQVCACADADPKTERRAVADVARRIGFKRMREETK